MRDTKLKKAREELINKMDNIIDKINQDITKGNVIPKMDNIIETLEAKKNK
jgi:hypothetical protein